MINPCVLTLPTLPLKSARQVCPFMAVVILRSSREGSASPFASLDPLPDPTPHLQGLDVRLHTIDKARAVAQIRTIVREHCDIIINLCDGAWDEDRAGIEVVRMLETLGVPFTGAGSSFYEPSREAMKLASHSVGVQIPSYVLAREHEDVERALARLAFPLLVKHPHGYSSVGISRTSLVDGPEALRREVASRLESYNGALIETFLPGREFTVLVSEPRAGDKHPWTLQPMEVIFPPGEIFQHFELKWIAHDSLQRRPVSEVRLEHQLRDAAALIFEAMGGTGYARCDFRLDADGELCFLEINPNCGLFYPEGSFGSADDILSADPAGFRGFLGHILDCARRRQQASAPRWSLEHHPQKGFGMVASRDLDAGEAIHRYEEQPHVLASREHVERSWDGIQSRWFADYAYPLSDEVHVLWSKDPEDWRPLNHSCDPNSWLDGLNLIARRPIARGEEISLDYATFCGPDMNGFVCSCSTEACRGLITSVDHLLPDLDSRYGTHLSPYVRQARTRLGSKVQPPYQWVPHPAGHGLVACRAWREGEVIAPFRLGERQPLPSRWTLQCGPGEHAEPLPIELRYINHSCHPNVCFDFEASVVRAVRAIEPGDDLTFFYPATEWQMTETFSCRCLAPDCLGFISGAAGLEEELLVRHVLSPTIRDLLRRRDLQTDCTPGTATS